MIALLPSWLVTAGRRSRRARRTVQPLTEALETRAVLSISITANFGGLTLPVTSVTLPRPTGFGTQDVSLILRPSTALAQLQRDAATGRVLNPVKIILSDGEVGTDTITLTDARISFREHHEDYSAE